MDFKVNVIKNFNKKLGCTLNFFTIIKEVYSNLQLEKDKVEESLSLVSLVAPSKIQEAVEEVNQIVKFINEIKDSYKSISSDIEQRINQENKIYEVQDIINKITYLKKLSLYLQLIKFTEDLSVELEISLNSGNDEACISSYIILKESCQSLQHSLCNNLKNYINNTLKFWYNEIKKKMFREYKEILKHLKWPFCGNNAKAIIVHNHEFLAKFKIITKHLFLLQLPNSILKETSLELSTNFISVSLPVTLLVHPLKQRFLYHFTGIKQTNRRDKPEWFFTQILTWIKDHSEWLETIVQPIADATGLKKINIKVEFMRALVELVAEKLESELCIVQYDDSLFAHTVDEALGFEKELRDTFLYPSLYSTTIFVLTQPQIFSKWITMEKKYATEKMDAILSSDTAWYKLPGYEANEMKVTECAEEFLTLLSTISDRYNYLPQPGHRLQFLDLQLELIDDFRVRLLQLLHENYNDPSLSLITSILNTSHYVYIILQNWGVTVPFLKLYFFKKQYKDIKTSIYEDLHTESVPEDYEQNLTIFDEAISLFQRLENKFIAEIGDSIFAEITAKSKPYCNEKWFSMSPEKKLVSLSVTVSGCQMFQEIIKQLHALHSTFALPLFQQSLKNLAMRLDQFLLNELILRNQFNTGGITQLQFDIKRNLHTLFGLYTNNVESYFPLIVEACILLNMLPGSAILLMEVLENDEDNAINEILADVNIHQLSPIKVLKVLNTRMDINTRPQKHEPFEID